MKTIGSLLEGEEPLTWLFYGDSITHGALHTFGWRDYTQHFAERVRGEMGRYTDAMINTAISGNTTAQLLQSFDLRVARFKPDVVFLMFAHTLFEALGIFNTADSRVCRFYLPRRAL